MPTPLPGMDPYIEASGRWPGFHAGFMIACQELLNQQLPRNYAAAVEEQILIEEQDPSVARRIVRADVAVMENPRIAPTPAPASATATIEPLTLAQEFEWDSPPKQLFIQILRLPGRQLVTDIEVLSPSNKERGSPDRVAYLLKRKRLLYADVNVVDVDLLVQGERLRLLEPLPIADYYAFVTRARARHRCSVYAWSVRHELPTISIPLQADDTDVQLDLQAALSWAYDRARLDRLMDYEEPPAFLAEEDRQWAAKLLRARSQ